MSRIPVEFTDEGDAYIPTDALKGITSQYEKQINELKMALQQAQTQQDYTSAFDDIVRDVVTENDYYSRAHDELRKARKWLNETVVEVQETHDIPGQMRPAAVLDLFAGTEIEEDFRREFPNIDMADALLMYDSTYHLRNALDNTAEYMNIRTKGPSKTDSAIRKLDPIAAAGLGEGAYSDDVIDKLLKEMRNEEIESYE